MLMSKTKMSVTGGMIGNMCAEEEMAFKIQPTVPSPPQTRTRRFGILQNFSKLFRIVSLE
jgi:hypothetical protein